MRTFGVVMFLAIIASASIAGTLRATTVRPGGLRTSYYHNGQEATERAAYASPRLGRRRQSRGARNPRSGHSDDDFGAEGYSYLGCYLDSLFDRVLEFGFDDERTTLERCYGYCAGEGAAFMGLQYGKQCWCGFGDAGGDPTRNGVGRCDYTCAGDGDTMCGGDLAFDLHEIYVERALAARAAPAPSPVAGQEDWPTNNPTPVLLDLWTAPTISPQTPDTLPPPSSKPASAGCADGIAGVRFGNVCCVEGCGACGGVECATVAGPFLGAADCCTTDIIESGISCDDSGVAPCVLARDEGGRSEHSSSSTPVTRGSTSATNAADTPPPRTDITTAATPIPLLGSPNPAPQTSPPLSYAAPLRPASSPPPSSSATPPPTPPNTAPAPVPGPTTEPPPPENTLLSLHHEARCLHNAEPLVYSDEVSASAMVHADALSRSCGELFHSSIDARNGYGENLFMCWGSETCYTPQLAMELLYENEIQADTVSGYGKHATQVLWKSTTHLGCALASCSVKATPYTYLVCQYDPPGNTGGSIDEEVELTQGTASC